MVKCFECTRAGQPCEFSGCIGRVSVHTVRKVYDLGFEWPKVDAKTQPLLEKPEEKWAPLDPTIVERATIHDVAVSQDIPPSPPAKKETPKTRTVAARGKHALAGKAAASPEAITVRSSPRRTNKRPAPESDSDIVEIPAPLKRAKATPRKAPATPSKPTPKALGKKRAASPPEVVSSDDAPSSVSSRAAPTISDGEFDRLLSQLKREKARRAAMGKKTAKGKKAT